MNAVNAVNAGLPPPLVALSPGDIDVSGERAFLARARAAIRAGLQGILLRESELGDRRFLALALALREELGHGWLGLHDRVHLALSAQADAVHVGFRSLRPALARDQLPVSIGVGFSAHAHDEPDAQRGADYLFFGPVLATPSKAGRLAPTGFDGLARACATCALPIWALGGLAGEDARAVRAAGARGLAVRAGIFGAPDPAAACALYRCAWESAASVK